MDGTVNSTNNNTTRQTPTLSENNTIGTLAACVLVKDENEGLNEWIAYHYLLWNLRHLVIALDPTFKTSPRHLLDQWNHLFQLTVVVWEEADYMHRDYSTFELRLGRNLLETNRNRNFTDEEKQLISNYINRQREFLRVWYGYFDKDQAATPTSSKWIVHFDVDEYLSWNPWLLRQESSSTTTLATRNPSPFPPLTTIQPTAGIMMKLFEEHYPGDDPSSSCLLYHGSCLGE